VHYLDSKVFDFIVARYNHEDSYMKLISLTILNKLDIRALKEYFNSYNIQW
jgi:hypothetical protein